MLYKDLISMFGASLGGRSAAGDDPVWHFVQSEELKCRREDTLAALQRAKVYLLDHNAASYADSLRDSVNEEAGVAAISILGEIQFPAPVTWVEFDYRELVVARFKRASPVTAHYDRAIGSGHRGFLIDCRKDEHLTILMFCRGKGSRIMDPLCTLRINRNSSGELDYNDVIEELNRPMLNFRAHLGDSAEKIQALRTMHIVDTGYDLFIPFALFAMVASPDLGGIIPSEVATFSSKDTKTARKFGKSWILGAQKSHLTIRIGPQAIAHMREKDARLKFERDNQSTRNEPVRHWVSEHERRYRSGKIVLIKGHRRGREPSTELPTRVMGPNHAAPIT